jgi:ankyrin repeat protein
MKKLKTFEDFNTDTDSEYDYKYNKNRVSGAGSEYGSTELIDAVKHEDIEAVEDLIKLGADVDEEDKQGKTAIDWLYDIKGSDTYNAIKKLLIDSGANTGYGHSHHSSNVHHSVLGD